MSHPNWLLALLDNPEEHDSEWGRSCHFCGSRHGRYDAPLEHYIDCPWLIACTELRIAVDPGRHALFEPIRSTPCEVCGWWYDSPEDWRGREMPAPAPEELRVAHDTHIAEEHDITYEEFLAGPPSKYPYNVLDGPMLWHDRWMREEMAERMTAAFVNVERGGISYIKPPDLSDIRSES